MTERWRSWLGRLAGPDPELTAQIDALAHERDELIEKLAAVQEASDQRARDLRAARRAAVAEAFEPVQVGECRKLRYLHRYDAEQHAIQVAAKNEGQAFNVYECRACPPYPGWNVRPWHVGGCPEGKPGSLYVNGMVLYHACGCMHAVNTGETLWTCDDHQGAA